MKIPDGSTCYSDGRIYDLSIAQNSNDFQLYFELAKTYGEPILELCCGTGRLAIPLSEYGFNVTGIDISKPLLTTAKQKAKEAKVKTEWVQGDCRNFELHKRFRLIYIALNSLAHFATIEDFAALVKSVKRHLAVDGRFVIAYLNPKLEILIRDPDKRVEVKEYFDDRLGANFIITEKNYYDRATQINNITWFYRNCKTNEEFSESLNMRIYFPNELEALLLYNGFEIENKYGDYDHRPFQSDSPLQIIICRKRKKT